MSLIILSIWLTPFDSVAADNTFQDRLISCEITTFGQPSSNGSLEKRLRLLEHQVFGTEGKGDVAERLGSVEKALGLPDDSTEPIKNAGAGRAPLQGSAAQNERQEFSQNQLPSTQAADLDAERLKLEAGLPQNAEHVGWAHPWIGIGIPGVAIVPIAKLNDVVRDRPNYCRPRWAKQWRGADRRSWQQLQMNPLPIGYYFFSLDDPANGPRGWYVRQSTPAGKLQRFGVFLDQPGTGTQEVRYPDPRRF